MADTPSLAITIVTYNSERYIQRCLASIAEQNYPDLQVIVVDNASTDSTSSVLAQAQGQFPCQVVYNRTNTGFAAAQNQAIGLSRSKWVLVLNPDVLFTPDFLHRLVEAGETVKQVGTVCGKLLAISPDLEQLDQPLLDSTGIFFTPELRHLDRGSRLPDNGRYDRFQYVFGATGAAALYRREMIEDISINREFFDSDFFAYREDADVSWRAQLLGWKTLYCPLAVAYHVRSVLPSNRGSLPALINMHSVKNRWLLRIKNMTGGLYRRFWLPVTVRDLLVVAACLTREWSSLPGFVFVLRNFKRIWHKRRQIMRRRCVSDAYLAQWFATEPVSFPVPEMANHITASRIEQNPIQ